MEEKSHKLKNVGEPPLQDEEEEMDSSSESPESNTVLPMP